MDDPRDDHQDQQHARQIPTNPAKAMPPTPLFIYGTLRALPLLAWVLTGCSSNTATAKALTRPGKARGYTRRALHNRDYPAAVAEPGSWIDGDLLMVANTSQRRKLDDFEGESYKLVSVLVVLEPGGEGGPGEEETVMADMYVWNGDQDSVSEEPWDLDVFVKERLEDWIDLFDGMELVGEESQDDVTEG